MLTVVILVVLIVPSIIIYCAIMLGVITAEVIKPSVNMPAGAATIAIKAFVWDNCFKRVP
jgi:hypothetical protein